MIYLITGFPGNGKSLRAMWFLLDAWERNQAQVKAGKGVEREFYTNIAGATLDENPNAFPWLKKLPDHNDWTQLPDGSMVVYDEAHSDGNTPGLERYGHLFPSTGKPGESNDPRIRSMSTHRHRGFDIVLLTQWPNKIHHQVRTLIGSHTHMNRAFGLAKAGVLQWTRVQVDPYDEKARDNAEEEIWTYPKGLYERYKSSSLHTDSHKFRMPKKVWQGLSTMVFVVLAALGIWYWVSSKHPAKKETPASQASADQSAPALVAPPAASGRDVKKDEIPGAGQFMALKVAGAPTLAGCVSSDRGCRCFNTDGYQIDMEDHLCRDTISRPLPFNVYHEYKPPQAYQVASQQPSVGQGAIGVPGATIGGSERERVGSGADVMPRAPAYETPTAISTSSNM
ncbi:hypothetical protein EA656_02505 [Pseudoxanthomonas winnipegensis]|uniref:Zona occludens toxin N-terminal domain-containing protein n=1 Tax=Pseudoxanthomonas winnipegensis TaxID=2480810 RepID=A0A4Q8LY99_9GAMM|nr:zonular occludens toxin domain-containing protein [Pseudoxanthomonas winnipegensis]TAA37558.1 hypothetical protein EA656_02505 [Pseudoxanthomonas winnipegensis]